MKTALLALAAGFMLVFYYADYYSNPAPWELVSAEEEKAYFFDCLKHAPISGTQIVQGCEESANNYRLTLGLERARNSGVSK